MQITQQYVKNAMKSWVMRNSTSGTLGRFTGWFVFVGVIVIFIIVFTGVGGEDMQGTLVFAFFGMLAVLLIVKGVYQMVLRNTINEFAYVRCIVEGVVHRDNRRNNVRVHATDVVVFGHPVYLYLGGGLPMLDGGFEVYVFFGNGHVLFAMPVSAGEVVDIPQVTQEVAMNEMKWW